MNDPTAMNRMFLSIVLVFLIIALPAYSMDNRTKEVAGNISGSTPEPQNSNLFEKWNIWWIVATISAITAIILFVLSGIRYIRGIKNYGAKYVCQPLVPTPIQHRAEKRSMQPKSKEIDGLIINIPYARNLCFTGRKSLLSDLRTSLTSSKNGAMIQAVTGTGGVGKTQLALEYTYRYINEYKVIWWIRSERPTTLKEDYADLAKRLVSLEECPEDLDILKEAVMQWLENNSGWLLVFDNALDPEEIEQYLPRTGLGHVLITSRKPIWEIIANSIEVPKFTRLESVEFLLKRMEQRDETAICTLAKTLGDFPLALEQAGAYVKTAKITPTEYLDLLSKRRKEVLKKGKPNDYPYTITDTWDISIRAIKKTHPEAIDLLKLIAFLSPDNIPISLLTGLSRKLIENTYIAKLYDLAITLKLYYLYDPLLDFSVILMNNSIGHLSKKGYIQKVEVIPEPLSHALKDRIKFNELIGVLISYSLIEITKNDAISLHVLVQTVTIDKMNEKEKKKWAKASILLVNLAYPQNFGNARDYQISTLLLPHALSTSRHAETLGIEPNAISRIMNQIALYLRARGDFSDAKICAEKSLAISEKIYRPNHPHVANRLNTLGVILLSLGDFKGGKDLLEKSLAIHKGKDALAIANLAYFWGELGYPEEAKEYLEVALGVAYDSASKTDPIKIALILNNLGVIWDRLGDPIKANKYYESSLEVVKSSSVSDNALEASIFSNIGLVRMKVGRLEEAKNSFERALNINEQIYGQNHLDVANDINNLGKVLEALGERQQAKECYVGALKILQDRLGENHPATKIVHNNLDSLNNNSAEAK